MKQHINLNRRKRYAAVSILNKYLKMKRKGESKFIHKRKSKRMGKQKREDILYKLKQTLVTYMRTNNLPADDSNSPSKHRKTSAFYYQEANKILQTLKAAQAIQHKQANKDLNYIKYKISELLAKKETKSNDYMKFIALTGISEHHNTTQGFGQKEDIDADLPNKKIYYVRTTKSKATKTGESMISENDDTGTPEEYSNLEDISPEERYYSKDGDEIMVDKMKEVVDDTAIYQDLNIAATEDVHEIFYDSDIHEVFSDSDDEFELNESDSNQASTYYEKSTETDKSFFDKTQTNYVADTHEIRNSLSNGIEKFGSENGKINGESTKTSFGSEIFEGGLEEKFDIQQILTPKQIMEDKIDSMFLMIPQLKKMVENFSGSIISQEYENMQEMLTDKIIRLDSLLLADFPDLREKRKNFIGAVENLSLTLKNTANNTGKSMKTYEDISSLNPDVGDVQIEDLRNSKLLESGKQKDLNDPLLNCKQVLEDKIDLMYLMIPELNTIVENFSGSVTSQEYKNLQEMLTDRIIPIDKLPLTDFPDLRERRKKFINTIENLSLKLTNQANSIEKSVETYEDINPLHQNIDDVQIDDDVNSSKLSESVTQNDLNDQLTQEVIQGLFSEKDDFDYLPNKNCEKQKANQKILLQKEIEKNYHSLPQFKQMVEDFPGIKNSQNYKCIEELMTNKIIDLDKLELSEFPDLREQRKVFIKSIENISKMLQNKATENESKSKEDGHEEENMSNHDTSHSELMNKGVSWKCSVEKCGFHFNNYTSEALKELISVYELLATLKYENLEQFTAKMFICTAKEDQNKMGHSLECYNYHNLLTFKNESNCEDPLLILKRLYDHFPLIRTITRRLYSLKQAFLVANDLRNIHEQPVEKVYDMYVKYKKYTIDSNKEINSNLARPFINMDSICEKYKAQIEEFQASNNPRISHDLPLYNCFSCNVLHKFTQVSDLVSLKSYPEDSHYWNKIIEHTQINLEKIKDTKLEKSTRKKHELQSEFKGKYFICSGCKEKFREKKLPPRCVLNKMDTCPKNEIIDSLNEYERLLISRAHSFRTILTATNKSGRRNIPSNRRHKKTTGVSIHLPLDIDATLKSVLADEEVLNTRNLELSVSSKAGKKKIVWQDVVDITKVYRAIKYLKDEVKNPHYRTLPELPATPQEFAEKYLQSEILRAEYDPDLDDDDPPTIDVNLDDTNTDTENTGNKPDDVINNEELSNENLNEDPDIEINVESDSLLSKLSPEQLKHNKEYYTIMPIHNNRKIDTLLPKYGLNKVQGEALSDFTEKNIDTLSHPDLFYNGQYGENDPSREVHIGKSAYAEARLMSSDPRFRQDKTYLFDLANSKTKRDINSAIFQTLNCKKDGTNRTAEEILNDETVEKDINTVFSKVRGTDEYMRIKRCDTETMLTNYGPATWFLTLSPNEWLWDDLAPFLSDERVNPNLYEKVKKKPLTTAELSVIDPVMTAVFIENRFQNMLKFICSKANPLGQISHYVIRREYQGRLVSHFHCMMWVDDAPTIGEVSPEVVANYIQQYITCQLPPVGSKLHNIVKNVQIHRCNSYCTRSYQLRNKKIVKACRFKFPREPRDDFLLNDVATSAAAKKTHSKIRLYELPRSAHEVNVNDYNPILLYMWNSNMDLQFIKEPTCTVSHYIGKYAFKAEETNLNADFLKSSKSPRSTIWSIGMKGLAGREIGTIEAADCLLGHFLVKTDPKTSIRFVDTNMNKFRKLKSKQELLELESSNSTDIFVPNNIDDRYPNRPEEMEDCNLFDYIANFDYKGSQKTSPNYIALKNNKGYILKRSTPTLISHRRPNKVNNKEEYFRNLLLLFKPYRQPIDVKVADTYEESFNIESQVNKRLQDYEKKISDLYESRENMKKRINEEKIVQEGEPVPESFEFTMDNTSNILEEFEKANENLPTNYENLYSMLNEDQKKIFIDVVSRIHVQTDVAVPENMKNQFNLTRNNKQILKFISGVGGTGKSFLITAITSYIRAVFKKDVALVAPTGIAASNINGFTIHRFLKLPVQHNTIPKYAPLSDVNLNESVNLMKNISLWFCDEVSMLNNITLQYIHKRMCEINGNNDQIFGGNNVIFVGDLLQLAPIQEDEVFEPVTNRQKKKYLNNLVAPQLWRQLEFNELTINQRQLEDPIFANILNNIRNGNLQEKDYHYLEEKCKFNFSENSTAEENKKRLATFIIEEQQKGNDYTILLPTNKLCREINSAILDLHHDMQYTNGKYIQAKDIVVRRNRKATNYSDKDIEDRIKELEDDPRNTAGLERNLKVKLGCKVMLRQNLDIPSGLCNGAIGTLVEVVEMDGQVDHLIININQKNHKIERRQSDFFLFPNNMIKVTRSQFPITLSYCLTVHKSQGLTLKHAIMDCGQDIFSVAQIYVALSRVKKAEDLKLLNFRVDSIQASHKAIEEYNRLRRISGLRSHNVTPTNKVKFPKYKHQQYTTTPPKRRKIVDPPIFTGSGSEVNPSGDNFGTFKKENESYTNSVLQCLLQTINPSILTNSKNLKELISVSKQYNKNMKNIDNTDLRNIVMGHNIYTDKTISPEEFLKKLISLNKTLHESFRININESKRCLSPSCPSFDDEKELYILSLNPGKTPQTMQQIYEENKSTFSETESCSNCNQSLHIQNTIETNDFLIFKLNYDKPAVERNHKYYLVKIKGIPNNEITINDKKYRFTAMVQHIGQAVHSIHTKFAAVLKKNNKSYIIRDPNVNQLKKWPDNGVDTLTYGTPHLLFYQRK